MSIFRRKKQTDAETESLKSFLDMIAPSIVKFETGYYICGNTFRCIWALREYPTSTDDLAILRHLGEKHGVTLHIYTRMVSPLEERKIVHNAEIRNRMNRGSAQDMQRAVEAESNLQDVANLIGSLHRNKEPLLHCAVYIEMIAGDMQELQILQTNVEVELMRSKLNVDRLKLRQQAGFCAVSPVGFNVLGTEYERVLPASSVANLFPFNYSGKTDRKGFYIGKDKYGSNIVVDFDQRDEDKTSANVLILGNSGQGKSYLMKLLLLNFLEAGKSVITLDVEHEQWELCQALGGCFADIIEGTYKINLLEPRCWDTDADPYDVDAPKAFRQSTRLAQHTSFLKDVFRTYKDFTTAQIDTIEIISGNSIDNHHRSTQTTNIKTIVISTRFTRILFNVQSWDFTLKCIGDIRSTYGHYLLSTHRSYRTCYLLPFLSSISHDNNLLQLRIIFRKGNRQKVTSFHWYFLCLKTYKREH